MIHRKYCNKIDIQLIKQYQKVVKNEVVDMVKSEIKVTEDAIHKASVAEIESNQLKALNIEILDLLKVELGKCEYSLEVEYTETYDTTKDTLDTLKELVTKYRPQALKDVFAYNSKNMTEWEETEHTENITKRDLYIKRATMPLSEIVQQVQSRMSFYSIYELIDNITANKIKIKKLKNQVRIEKREVDEISGVCKILIRDSKALKKRVIKLENADKRNTLKL